MSSGFEFLVERIKTTVFWSHRSPEEKQFLTETVLELKNL